MEEDLKALFEDKRAAIFPETLLESIKYSLFSSGEKTASYPEQGCGGDVGGVWPVQDGRCCYRDDSYLFFNS